MAIKVLLLDADSILRSVRNSDGSETMRWLFDPHRIMDFQLTIHAIEGADADIFALIDEQAKRGIIPRDHVIGIRNRVSGYFGSGSHLHRIKKLTSMDENDPAVRDILTVLHQFQKGWQRDMIETEIRHWHAISVESRFIVSSDSVLHRIAAAMHLNVIDPTRNSLEEVAHKLAQRG